DSFLKIRLQGNDLLSSIDDQIADFISEESLRPPSHFNFFTLASNELISVNAVGFSPLANTVKPEAKKQGITGYFQIAADGSRSTPILPDADITTISNQSENI